MKCIKCGKEIGEEELFYILELDTYLNYRICE